MYGRDRRAKNKLNGEMDVGSRTSQEIRLSVGWMAKQRSQLHLPSKKTWVIVKIIWTSAETQRVTVWLHRFQVITGFYSSNECNKQRNYRALERVRIVGVPK